MAWAPLEKLISHLDQWHDSSSKARPKEYKFIFVVPDSKFNQMSLQKFLNKDGQVYKKNPKEIGRLHQQAMEVPMQRSSS